MTVSTRSIVVGGMLIAVTLLLAFTNLGYFPVPNVTGRATILHVPAIIGGVVEGPLVGGIVGLVLGISSYFLPEVQPLFAGRPFWQPILVLIVPRVLIGIFAYYTYQALRKRNEIVALASAGVVGTLTNTVLVLSFAAILGILPWSIFLVVWPQALFEMIVAALLTVAVVAAWKGIERGRKGSSV
ncbi:MAG: ECF transporter S component [Caldilineaceae bacterium]